MTEKAKSPKAAPMMANSTGLWLPGKGYFVSVNASTKVCDKSQAKRLARHEVAPRDRRLTRSLAAALIGRTNSCPDRRGTVHVEVPRRYMRRSTWWCGGVACMARNDRAGG